MYQELKQSIIEWLFTHSNEWQRVNACHEEFSPYIYDKNGKYLIGGEEVSEFILDADALIYER